MKMLNYTKNVLKGLVRSKIPTEKKLMIYEQNTSDVLRRTKIVRISEY